MKKFIATLLAAAMAVTCLPQAAIAEPVQQEKPAETVPQEEPVSAVPQEAKTLASGEYQNFKYSERYDGTLSITGYTGSDTEITIPSRIEGKKVTTIGYYAFSNQSSLTKVTLPSELKSIETGAFSNCTSLTEIKIPDSVTSIYQMAFYGCKSLEKASLPKSITNIQYGTFAYCSSLPEIDIPDKVRSIYSGYDLGPFVGCTALKKAVIPSSVTSIYDGSFSTDSSPDLTFYGYTNSKAESYAKKNEIPFVSKGLFLENEDYISVTADTGVIPADTQLSVEKTEDTGSSVSYNITLTQNGEKIQPDGTVTVRIPIPYYTWIWSDVTVRVYYKDDNGNLTNMHAVVSDGDVVFTTDHFSEYILTTEKLIESEPGDVNNDGEVGELDSVELARYLANWSVTIDKDAADLDGDGEVGETDSVILARRLAGWNV